MTKKAWRPSDSEDAEKSSAFALLDRRIQRWIWEQKWTELRDVQERSIPTILDGRRDVILAAATAAGKTEAAFLPICSRMLLDPVSSIQALYVGPLKALINDQWDRLDLLCDSLEIPVHRWHGDVGPAAKKRMLAEPKGILLITPESLEAMFVVRGPEVRRIFRQLQFVVLDELHSFLGNERGRQLQSLLHRIEVSIQRRVPRIGLSATVGEMKLAADFLRPSEGGAVETIVSPSGEQELRLQLRAYRTPPEATTEDGSEKAKPPSADRLIAGDLFRLLRGSDNLIFANQRQRVEVLADRLRCLSEKEKVPNEFFPHHGSLSKDLREEVEALLKDRSRPVNVVATSTLEMGIDIGTVESIAQIGAPPSVASLRQRLGRSGRRGRAAVLRVFISEPCIDETSSPQDMLRAELVESIAIVDLMLARWCEPPVSGVLHLSTLVQQVLSTIAERGGTTAAQAFESLVETGPFRQVTARQFEVFLRGLGRADLITQMSDGTLIPGVVGERILNGRDFYAAFCSPEEYRLTCGNRTLGTIPISHPLSVGGFLIFAGRRWKVLSVDDAARRVDLEPAGGGRAPIFGGGGGAVHDRVREEMFSVYQAFDVPTFLDENARELLGEGRENFARLGLRSRAIIQGGRQTHVFPWSGDRVLDTIVLQLKGRGFSVENHGISVVVSNSNEETVLDEMVGLVREGPADGFELALGVRNRIREKYDQFLDEGLLSADFASRSLDVDGAWSAMKRILVLEGACPPDLMDKELGADPRRGEDPACEVPDAGSEGEVGGKDE